ncbi:MAG: hypothetical protein GY705_07310 [Bacteroidetes bacterium]|nr:hypothetical protein [Bacteroidota bacterium]
MRNPTRRNKNIGKTQGGRVKDGRADEKWSRLWFNTDIYSRISESKELWQIYKENPSKHYFHPCEGKEYINILELLPEDLTKYVKAIILPRISKRDAKYGVDAKRRSDCIIINPFPKSLEFTWATKPKDSTIRHYAPWCTNWKGNSTEWKLQWSKKEAKKYCLYHLFLHELGHINQPWFHSRNKREEFAENFALEWASKFKVI